MKGEWDRWTAEFRAQWVEFRANPRKPPTALTQAVNCLADVDPEDIAWIERAMATHRELEDGKPITPWSHRLAFHALRQAQRLDESLFLPLMEAGINAVDPSDMSWYVRPCVRAFGYRRVFEYLVFVLENASDWRKAGAANGMYAARAAFLLESKMKSIDSEDATAEWEKLMLSHSDIWARQAAALLQAFVFNNDLDVRRSIISQLDVNATDYPEHLQPLVPKAIEIARTSPDEYIRHRLEAKLGALVPLMPLPHRRPPVGL